MNDEIDEAHLRRWIGREEEAEDILTPSLAARFHATLGLPGVAPGEGEAVPRLIHFCLCQPAVSMDALGDDGHPARGGFLPPVPLPRRMWAGSAIRFTGDLCVGDKVRRVSRIADVRLKRGRSGTLCFVDVDHRFMVNAQSVVTDRQTIVYRAPTDDAPPPTEPAPAPVGVATDSILASPPLLFRYSAITFNTHRIHYDRPYAVEEEGYPALVVHGPLQATLLLHFAARQSGGRPPDRFSFRSLSPLFDRDTVELHADAPIDGARVLWTARPGGPIAMRAEAGWD